VERFLGELGGRRPDLPLVLDCELERGSSPETITRVIRDCSLGLQDQAGFEYPMIYTRKTWWDLHVHRRPDWRLHPLWVAHYTRARTPWLPRDWTAFQCWQHSNQGEAALHGARGKYIDLNRWAGPLPGEQTVVPQSLQVEMRLIHGERVYAGAADLRLVE
jgi:GH25 family lysozyme M1 (1,4-beta-N-acetylmuramidase)